MSQKKENKKEYRPMEKFEKDRNRLNKSARLIAIVLIGVMIIFTFVTAGLFILE
ncbi:MAG: hypothetical protein GX083_05555 [Clostridiales bacterium]|nr:hypothetical protein [Clostridiales bacterium]